MKRPTVLALMTFVVLGNAVIPALADDPWFDKWDHNHDHRWDYNEFRAAHHSWAKQHREEKRLSEEELKAEWAKYNHDGYCNPDDVRTWHHW